jgi:hypothetical protein
MTTRSFLKVLFEPDEQTCFADTPYNIALGTTPIPGNTFFSINPMHTSRADANVTCYRNLMLECDNMPLEQQIEYVTSRIPVSTIVYSGGKSYHFIISLAEPCSTREEYDTLVRRIHALLPQVDPTTKNPSRFSRLPGAMRLDTGKMQDLVYKGSRISRATLEAKLPPLELPKVYEKAAGFFSTLVVDAMFKPDEVMQKVGISGRNAFFFWLGQRLSEGNASSSQKAAIVEQAYSNLRDKTDFRWTEASVAARVKE